MKLAHFLAVGLIFSYSLSAYAQRGAVNADRAIVADVAGASTPPAGDDEDWGESTQKAPKKAAPAPVPAPEPAQPLAAPSLAPESSDDLPTAKLGGAIERKIAPVQKAAASPTRKAHPALAAPQEKPISAESDAGGPSTTENTNNTAVKPSAVDPVPETEPAPKAAPVPHAHPAVRKAIAPVIKAPAQQATTKPAAEAPVLAPTPAPVASPLPPVTIPIKQVPAGVPLPANAAATPAAAPTAEGSIEPVKDSSSPDLTDDLRADPNTSTNATRAKARLRPSDVGLSAQQTNAILEIRKGAQSPAEKRLLEELKVAKVDLNASMIDATPAEELRKKFDLVQKKYLELQKIKFERTLRIREVLSVEQRKKLQGLKTSH